MRLIKSHGLGNDYLILHGWEGPSLTAKQAIALCDRHRGVGGDGVLEARAASDADYGLRIWNPDGSLAEKSGNGLRIFARYLVDHRGAPASFSVAVDAGVVRCHVAPSAVTVEMGSPTFLPDEIPCRQILRETPLEVVPGTFLPVTAVGVGNPHAVVFFPPDTDLDALPWRRWGAALERHPAFPNRTNVQLARVLGPGVLEVRIWERGAGETSASGSSACAVAAAAVSLGRAPAGPVELVMPGGSLSVTVGPTGALTLCGPVEEVGELRLSPVWWSDRSR